MEIYCTIERKCKKNDKKSNGLVMQIERERDNDNDAITYASWLGCDSAGRKNIFPFAEDGPRCSEPSERGKKFFHFGLDDFLEVCVRVRSAPCLSCC